NPPRVRRLRLLDRRPRVLLRPGRMALPREDFDAAPRRECDANQRPRRRLEAPHEPDARLATVIGDRRNEPQRSATSREGPLGRPEGEHGAVDHHRADHAEPEADGAGADDAAELCPAVIVGGPASFACARGTADDDAREASGDRQPYAQPEARKTHRNVAM